MFLPAVENHKLPSPYLDSIRTMQAASSEYPKIRHLFAFQPEATAHLARFTQQVMANALRARLATLARPKTAAADDGLQPGAPAARHPLSRDMIL